VVHNAGLAIQHYGQETDLSSVNAKISKPDYGVFVMWKWHVSCVKVNALLRVLEMEGTGKLMTDQVVALVLLVFVAVGELLKTKDDPEKWLLDTFARCLADVQLKDVVLEPR